jgi:hypothetical protein
MCGWERIKDGKELTPSKEQMIEKRFPAGTASILPDRGSPGPNFVLDREWRSMYINKLLHSSG